MPHVQSPKPYHPNIDAPAPNEPGAPPVEPDEGPVPALIPADPENDRVVASAAGQAWHGQLSRRQVEVATCL